MRITKALQEQIFANLLSQHDLQARAIAATQDRQHNLIKLAAHLAIAEGIGPFGTQAEIRAHYKKIRSAVPDSAFFGVSLYQSTATLSYSGDDNEISYCSDSGTAITLGGQRREFYLDGDVNREPEISLTDITPMGFELANVIPLFEEREEKKPGTSRHYPYYLPRSCPLLPSDHWFSKAIDANDAERRAIRGEFTTLKSTVFANLNKFGTVKKLVEAWPEIEPFLPKNLKPAGTGLALSREDLNAICGLPK